MEIVPSRRRHLAGRRRRLPVRRAGCPCRSVDLRIEDVAGRAVWVADEEAMTAGTHSLSWDGLGRLGRAVPAGVYYAELRANGGRSRRPFVVVK